MANVALKIVICVTAFVLGVVLPARDVFGDAGAVVNVYWGSIYGLGWALAGHAVGLRESMWFGVLIWPALVTMALYVGTGRVLASERRSTRILFFSTLGISLFLNFPAEKMFDGSFYYLPVLRILLYSVF